MIAKFRFPCGARILGTVIKPPEDFSKPVIVLTDEPEYRICDGQEELLQRIEEYRRRSIANARNGWREDYGDFYGTPRTLFDDLKREMIVPVGYVITPKFLRNSEGQEIYDGQMGFPATFVRFLANLPGYYAEFLLSPYWSRFVGQPKLYTS